MFYYSDQYQDAVFNTAEPNIIGESSQNGALAVNEKEQLIALSVNGGVAVYSYKMKEGIPSVTEKFRKEIAEMGGYVNDFELCDTRKEIIGIEQYIYRHRKCSKHFTYIAQPHDGNHYDICSKYNRNGRNI